MTVIQPHGRMAAFWRAARRDGRVDEGGGLENRCGATHRGFESLSLRLIISYPGEVPEWLNGGAC